MLCENTPNEEGETPKNTKEARQHSDILLNQHSDKKTKDRTNNNNQSELTEQLLKKLEEKCHKLT
jgi:hypothetical protein